MIGTIQKTVSLETLACSTCEHFRSHDVDLFYCEYNKKEFPNLCMLYQKVSDSSQIKVVNNEQ